MSNENHVSLTPRLLKDFDRSVSRVKRVLVTRYGTAESKVLIQESRQKYHDLIPKIPYVGEGNPMREVFLFPACQA